MATMDTTNNVFETYGVNDRIDCPCHKFTALSKIVDVLDDDDRTRAMIDWLNGDTDKISMEQQKLLSCGKRYQCRFRYGTSFAILNALRDTCKPFLETMAVTSSTTSITENTAATTTASAATVSSPDFNIGDELSFPPLPVSKSQKQSSLPNHPRLSNVSPAAAMSNQQEPNKKSMSVVNTLPTRKKKAKPGGGKQSISGGPSHGPGPMNGDIAPGGSLTRSIPRQTANECTNTMHQRPPMVSDKQPPRVDSTPFLSSDVHGVSPVWTKNTDPFATIPTTATQADPTLARKYDSTSPDIAMSPSVAASLMSTTQAPSSSKSSAEEELVTGCSIRIMRLVDVYVALIRNMLVPSTPLELHFLLQLIFFGSTSRSAPGDADTERENTPPAASPGTFFKPILQGREQCIQFSQNALKQLEESLLQRLSPFIIKPLLRSEAFQAACPSIAKKLRLNLPAGTSEDFTEAPTGTHAIWTLPFEKDRDSRHNYKTQAEISIYKNREESRDAFLSQLRSFMTAKSKVFLNQDADRAREVAEQESKRIIRNVSNVNMVWFAQFFCELLLQVGRSPVEEMDPDLLRIAEDRERLQQLHKRFSKKITHASNKNGNKKVVFSGQWNGGNHQNFCFSPFQEALPLFPGYQEFFFIFLYSVDSYNFAVHLLSQIATITKNLIFDRSPSGVEKRALDLQLAGRFLGVLVFSPNWRGEAIDWSKIQPAPAGDSSLKQLDFIGLPLSTVLSEAWEGGFLMLVIPWIAELLKMSRWDTLSQSSRVFRQVLANLRMIQDVATSKDGAIWFSPSIQIVSFHLETLFNDSFSLPKLTSLPRATLSKYSELVDGLDRLDIRLSHASLFASSPYLEDLVNMIDGVVREDQNTQVSRPKKLRPSIVSGSLSAEIPSFVLESPEGKPSYQSSAPFLDYSPAATRRTIQQKLVDEFFHQHRDLKVVCDFAVGQTLKNISGHALANFATQVSQQQKITSHSTERDIEDFQLRAIELSEDYIRDQVRDRVEKSLGLFGPVGLHQKVRDIAITLSVTGAFQSSRLLIRSLISAECKIILEGFGTSKYNRFNSGHQETPCHEPKTPEHFIVDAIKSIEVIKKNMSSTDPEHNLRLLGEASHFVELVTKSALIPSDSPLLRHLFEAIFALDRVSAAILRVSFQSETLYPWRVFVKFLHFASNLTKISSYGMKHLSGILGDDFLVRLTTGELASLSKESQALITQLAVKFGSKDYTQAVDCDMKPRALQYQ